MKRRYFAMLWAAAVVPMAWFHQSYGPTLLERDAAGAALRTARAAESRGDFAAAAAAYRSAQQTLAETNPDVNTALSMSMAVLRTQSHDKPIPERIEAWNRVLKTSAADASIRPELRNDIRLTLAGLHYESALLQARVGTPKSMWRNEADLARQQFAFVARTNGDGARATTAAANVERVYRLLQADRLTLMSRPLTPVQEQQAMQLQMTQPSNENEQNGEQPVNGDGRRSSGPETEPQKKPEAPERPRKGS